MRGLGLLITALCCAACFEYESQLTSAETKNEDTSPEDPSVAPDPGPDQGEQSDDSDESDIFDTWEEDPSFVFDECEVTCTPDGPVCDFDSCEECTGCCGCDILSGRESSCVDRGNAVLACNNGCLEREECRAGETCTQDFFESGASCEPCSPCSEPGESYCDVFGDGQSAFRCNENFCLVEERCAPGTACMYSRRPFQNEFGGQCSPIYQNCESELCSGFRFCEDDEFEDCGPCGCCEFDDGRDLCAAGPDGTYVLDAINSFECYEIDICEPQQSCTLTPNRETAYCADF